MQGALVAESHARRSRSNDSASSCSTRRRERTKDFRECVQALPPSSSSPAVGQPQPWVPAVDMRLASTYVPGVACIARTAVVALLLSREWFSKNTTLLMMFGIALYVDRILRRDVIVDSSAMSTTMFAVHMLNLCRCALETWLNLLDTADVHARDMAQFA